MTTVGHRVGEWVAVEEDGQVYTGVITEITHRRARTTMKIDILADNQYRSRVFRHTTQGETDE